MLLAVFVFYVIVSNFVHREFIRSARRRMNSTDDDVVAMSVELANARQRLHDYANALNRTQASVSTHVDEIRDLRARLQGVEDELDRLYSQPQANRATRPLRRISFEGSDRT